MRLSDRVEALALKVWRNHVTNMIHTANFEWRRDNFNTAEAFLHKIREKLTHFEDEILRLKEDTSILELALWNLKLNMTIHQDLSTRHQKKRLMNQTFDNNAVFYVELKLSLVKCVAISNHYIVDKGSDLIGIGVR